MSLQIAFIGGGEQSFIGRVHCKAIKEVRNGTLSCGIFSRDAEKSKSAALFYGLSPEKAYTTFEDLLSNEPIDVVVIATPNATHFQLAKQALLARKHVICDKPITQTVNEALELQQLQRQNKKVFAVTHTYSGYAMIRKAKQLVANDTIGSIEKVAIQYFQGWKFTFSDQEILQNNSPADIGGTIADIGTHAFHMVEDVTGLKINSLYAKLSKAFSQRPLNDNAVMLAELENGKLVTIDVAQVATGEENRINLRVYGSDGAVIWNQETGNELSLLQANKAPKYFQNSNTKPNYTKLDLPPGHNENFQLGMNQIYEDVLNHIVQLELGNTIKPPVFPTLQDGLRGMKFIEACLKSNKTNAWVNIS